jgi:elongation factor Ts
VKIDIGTIKKLREMSSASVSDCKKALEQTKGNLDEAVLVLRKRGLEIAAAKQDRVALEGRIEAYVHLGNKIGVLLEVNCETDFVARNEDFCRFTKDVAMQITASNPLYINKEDVPKIALKEHKDHQDFYKQHCLLEQPFIKDPNITIRDYLASLIAKIGENIIIRRFTRYKLGE